MQVISDNRRFWLIWRVSVHLKIPLSHPHKPYIIPYITTFTADSFSSQEHRPQAQVSFASLIRILSTNDVQTPSRLLVCVFDLKRSENLISEALVKRDRHQKTCHRISVYPWHKELSVCRLCCRSPRDKELCRFWTLSL